MTVGFDARSTAQGHRPHLNRTRRGLNLERLVGVWGGSPGLRRGSVTGANEVVDDGGYLGTSGPPRVVAIDGALLLQQRRSPMKFRWPGARLALGKRWGGSEREGN